MRIIKKLHFVLFIMITLLFLSIIYEGTVAKVYDENNYRKDDNGIKSRATYLNYKNTIDVDISLSDDINTGDIKIEYSIVMFMFNEKVDDCEIITGLEFNIFDIESDNRVYVYNNHDDIRVIDTCYLNNPIINESGWNNIVGDNRTKVFSMTSRVNNMNLHSLSAYEYPYDELEMNFTLITFSQVADYNINWDIKFIGRDLDIMKFDDGYAEVFAKRLNIYRYSPIVLFFMMTILFISILMINDIVIYYQMCIGLIIGLWTTRQFIVPSYITISLKIDYILLNAYVFFIIVMFYKGLIMFYQSRKNKSK